MQHHGIGIHYEAAGHFHQAKVFLEKDQDHACYKADEHAQERYHPSFKDENPPYQRVVGPEGVKGGDVFLLFDNQHRQRTEDVERHNYHHEHEDKPYGRLFVAHHPVQGGMLPVAVQHAESLAQLFRKGFGEDSGFTP